MSSSVNLTNSCPGPFLKLGQGQDFIRLNHIQEVMGDQGLLFGGRFGRANIQPPVDLPGVG